MNNLIIARKTTLRSRLLGALLIGLIIGGGWLLFELGQNRAGFNRLAAMGERAQLEAEIERLTTDNKRLSEQVAALDVAARVDREAYKQVEGELIALQTRILEQQEDIEFYKGIVNENDGTGLRIQDFQVSRGLGEREFDVRLVLAQAFRSDRQVSGEVDLVIEGMQRGKAARLGLAELGGEGAGGKPLKYSFRYFQDLKAAVVLPAGFDPERVHVIVRTRGKTSKTVEEFFIWDVKPG